MPVNVRIFIALVSGSSLCIRALKIGLRTVSLKKPDSELEVGGRDLGEMLQKPLCFLVKV